MAATTKIPVTIVTGFLGAGKTTLISRLVEQAHGTRLALIVNEFGDLGFDGDRMAECGTPGCRADEVIELTNGCICCTVADDFLPAMEALLAREPAPDHIIIETSGLALPQPLVQAFQWPAVRSRVTVDGVVTVADAAALSQGRVATDIGAVHQQREADNALDHDDPVEELFGDQLACADLIVLSKSDLVGGEARARIALDIGKRARPSVRVVEAARGAVPSSVLLGLSAAAEDDLAGRYGHHHHEADEHHDHDHDAFESFVVPASPASSLDALKARVADAMALDGVLRIKGAATVEGRSSSAIVQAVGPRVDAYFTSGAVDRSGLVVIGLAGVDYSGVKAALAG